MPKLNLHRRDHMTTVVNDFTADELQQRLGSKFAKPEKKQPRTPYLTTKAVERRWQMLDNDEAKAQLLDGHTQEQMLCYNKNIENFIGTVKMPIGIAGPLRVNGLFAQDDFHVPLATTEAALVASYNRGSQLITQAGGASAMLLNEGVTRTPCFAFFDLAQAGQFVAWVVTQYDEFRSIAESTTRHGKLADISVNIEGNHVYLVFEYLTGDASGQNMVTISTNAVFEHILSHSPIKPLEAFLDGNLSGDKKATAQTLRGVRGKKVTAEINIDKVLIEKMLHTTPQKMAEFARMNTIGGTLSGSIGINAHYANALAAFYIACGQDAACVAESAVGITRIEVNQHGGLYASVTLPNLMVGTVGGGTSLPSQKACLDLLGLHGSGNSQALSEVCAALCLAGELSIVGAFCAGHFSRAHHKLAR
ncbi:3-hydroxy-3-methylglutaryl-CoA reductase [Photobacterium gaetbulicola]|uniref:hydroxymethylglutaryl-CoA reductase (NADPH) n=1 Tax=Photobacterium gaetbulicola Gung47 TaxID=658445 RepID=A0A0C5W3Q0_9GAMM|nr:hydroxymethylglutaryl-CoA reductase [Photobacterium gaetbulicola]AJR06096.1 3-hydroxy-3-methylglutaryl-coenzyme A reductase [Photobacterium gaetbulicola Gung47]PSU02714.1 3-hydroxy-3-methylglutaryl-CoA reductase [Photobacterium gaetbulicola]